MAKYAYRCSNCRKRMMLNKPLEEYRTKMMKHINRAGKEVDIVAAKKCSCGHARFYVDKARNARPSIERANPCMCAGYNYKHRKGSKFCVHNPDYEFNWRVCRLGEDKLDVLVDIGFDNARIMGADEPCPF